MKSNKDSLLTTGKINKVFVLMQNLFNIMENCCFIVIMHYMKGMFYASGTEKSINFNKALNDIGK